MIRRIWLLLPLAFLGTGLLCGSGSVEGKNIRPIILPKPRPWEDYKLLEQLNIFSRNRKRRERFVPSKRKETRVERRRVSIDPGSYIVLVGVSRVGERLFAFFEDRREGRVYVVSVGGIVKDLKVKEINLDEVTLEGEGGRNQKVRVGMSVTGKKPEAPTRAFTAKREEKKEEEKVSESSKKAEEGEGSSSLQSILEKLRRRRQQELEK